MADYKITIEDLRKKETVLSHEVDMVLGIGFDPATLGFITFRPDSVDNELLAETIYNGYRYLDHLVRSNPVVAELLKDLRKGGGKNDAPSDNQ